MAAVRGRADASAHDLLAGVQILHRKLARLVERDLRRLGRQSPGGRGETARVRVGEVRTTAARSRQRSTKTSRMAFSASTWTE
jgi:hypothetical protein